MISCDLEALLDNLKDGLATRLSEDGVGLSNGERARLALARALLVKPSVLLLDEAEAHLDTEAGRTLARAIQRFPGTVVYTSHNRARAAAADRIAGLRRGRLVSVGPPAELLAAVEVVDDPKEALRAITPAQSRVA